MKKFAFYFLLLFYTVGSYSQNAYCDALTLRKYLELDATTGTLKFVLTVPNTNSNAAAINARAKEYADLINNNYYDGQAGATVKQLHTILSDVSDPHYNPFLAEFMRPSSVLAANRVALKNDGINGLISQAGNLNVTNFADGLAKFLVQRSKEELNIAFFRRFNDFLKGYPEATTLFPTTSDFLKNINAYQYAAMLPALREGFHKDLNTFADNLLKLRYLTTADCSGDTNCQNRINAIITFSKTTAGRSLVGALIVGNNLIKGKNGADIIQNLASDVAFQPTAAPYDDNLSNLVQFASLISVSLRSNDAGKTWISKTEIENLVKDEATFKLYLGLLYANNQKTNFNGHHIQMNFGGGSLVTLQDILTKLQSNWAVASGTFKANFTKMAYSASEASESASNIISSQKQVLAPSAEMYEGYAISLTDFIKTALQFLQSTPGVNATTLNADITNIAERLDAIIDCVNDIKQQNYNALVMHTSDFLTLMLDKQYTFKEDYIKYGTFIASVVEAKNSDEVETAIEAAVLPVGSSSIKRETKSNIALNAYIGGFAGGEYMPALREHRNAFSMGIAAPVGIAFSWGNLWRCKNKPDSGGKSFSIFVSLIDVGAVAAYRFGDSQTNIASDIELKNIVSPGLFFYVGLGKCPVSIGAGAQIGPQLRGVSDEGVIDDKTDNIYFRYGLSVVVDIPLLNLHTKTK